MVVITVGTFFSFFFSFSFFLKSVPENIQSLDRCLIVSKGCVTRGKSVVLV